MKSILLMRHGKSERDAPGLRDHDRPLNGRGRRAAALMGRFLAGLEGGPDLVICSTAVRAHETARIAREAGRWRGRLILDNELYEATPQALLDRVRGLEDVHDGVLLVGHEPTWSEFASRLIDPRGSGGSRAGGRAALRFPTAAVARIDLPTAAWKDVAFGDGTLLWLVTPKLLASIS